MTETQSLKYDDMLAVFERDGAIESNSPKNRKRLYAHLRRNRIPFKTEVIGYTRSAKTACRHSTGRTVHWNTKKVARWIEAKRFVRDDVEAECAKPVYTGTWSFSDIEAAFTDGLSARQIVAILNEGWGPTLAWSKWSPFDTVPLRKSIVRIWRTD